MSYHKARPVPPTADKRVATDQFGSFPVIVDGGVVYDELLWRLPTYSGAPK